MPRRIAVNEIGSIHHVTQRGNNRSRIFPNPWDKDCFIRMLGRYVQEMGMILLHYVVMDNHYHLLMEVGEIPLDRFMMRLNRGYAWYFNKRYKRTGTIYENRYHNYIVQGTAYYWSVVRYIVQNPVKAKIVAQPGSYAWGAHAAVCSGLPSFSCMGRMLSYFSDEPEKALLQYFTCSEGSVNDLENTKMLQDLGFDWQDYEPDIGAATIVDPTIDIPERLWVLLHSVVASSDWIIEESMKYERVVDAVMVGSKKHRIRSVFKPLRDQFILLATADGHAYTDVAAFLGISRETVRRVVKNTW